MTPAAPAIPWLRQGRSEKTAPIDQDAVGLDQQECRAWEESEMSKTEMNAKVSAEKKSPTVTVTITAVMVAFVFVVTYFLSAPIPNLVGQAVFDAGDIDVFIFSLIFGPIVGGIAVRYCTALYVA